MSNIEMDTIDKKDFIIAGSGASGLAAMTAFLTQTIPLLLMMGAFYFVFILLFRIR